MCAYVCMYQGIFFFTIFLLNQEVRRHHFAPRCSKTLDSTRQWESFYACCLIILFILVGVKGTLRFLISLEYSQIYKAAWGWSPSCLFSLLLLFVFGFVLVLDLDQETVCGTRILGLKGFRVHGQDRDELAGCRVRPWQSGARAARPPEQCSPDDYCWTIAGCVKFLSSEMLITPSSWKWNKTKTPSILQAKENMSP